MNTIYQATRRLFSLTTYSAPYQYTKIPATHIRLLRLTRDRSGLLKSWTLSSFDIDESPPYVALSYTWGEATSLLSNTGIRVFEWKSEQYMSLDNQSLQISRNLADFLKIWESEEQPEWIWIDAISINQSDLNERASQVQLMGEIYSRAEFVLVWLGASISHLESVRWLLQDFLDAVEKYTSEHGVDRIIQMNLRDPALPHMLGLSDSTDEIVRRLQEYRIFNDTRRWFERAWIVQEVALAREIVVLCGTEVLPWQRMNDLSQLIILSKWNDDLVGQFSTAGKVTKLGHQINSLEILRSFSKGGECEEAKQLLKLLQNCSNDATAEELWYNRLLYLLTGVRKQLASRDDDKVYCILGMASRFLPKDMKLPIQPDYTKSTRDVYLDVATTLVQQASHLRLLSAVEDKGIRRLHDLPSWVPDFTVRTRGSEILLPGGSNIYNVCGSINHQTSISVIKDVLQLPGVHVDTVSETCECISHLEIMPDMLRLIAFMRRFDKQYHPTGQPRVESICRTLLADMKWDRTGSIIHPLPSDIVMNFHQWLCYKLAMPLYESYKRPWDRFKYVNELEDTIQEFDSEIALGIFPSKAEILQFESQMINLQKRLRIGKSTKQDIEELVKKIDGSNAEFAVPMLRVNCDRRLYRTTKGYLGLGPLSITKGDSIVVLIGAMVPFSLRQRSNESIYELIGETYLHGFMHGEAFTTELQPFVETLHVV
jgi:hypothetical protein